MIGLCRRQAVGLTCGRIVATATSGADPVIMLTWPQLPPAVFDRAGLTVDDIDLFELNGAFASAVPVPEGPNIPDEKLNVNGGAIAMATWCHRGRDDPGHHGRRTGAPQRPTHSSRCASGAAWVSRRSHREGA